MDQHSQSGSEKAPQVLLELDSSDVRKGAVRDALDLAQSASFGFTCTLCGSLDSAFKQLAGRLGVSIADGRSRMLSKRELPAYSLSVASWIWRLRRLRPDVVHLNYAGWGPSLGCAAHLLGIPIVARAGVGFDPRNPTQKWIDAYVANSEAHGESLRDTPLAQRVVVTGPLFYHAAPNAESVEGPIPSKGSGACVVLFLGQIVERKGIGVLVDALPLLGVDTHVMIVGGNWQDDAYASTIRGRIEELRVGSRVWLSNHRNDVQNLLRHSDILVLPSFHEALPRVIIEAMLGGVSVVATAVGAIPTLIEDGVTGFLVQPGDSKALANAINRLVDSPELRARIGQAGQELAHARLRPELTLERYAELYRRLASRRLSRDSSG